MPYVDFHAHIAPGIDHGSADLGHSLAQLDAARRAGVGVIVATPHFYMSDGASPDEFAAARNEALKKLIETSQSGPRIVPAAEVHLSPGISQLEGLELLRVEGSEMMLIEMPYGLPGAWAYDELNALSHLGYRVIIAHIDRYPRTCVENLLQMGFDMQINADTVSSFFGFRRVLPYLRSGAVKALGSDVHGLPERSYRQYLKAAKRLTEFDLPFLDESNIKI